MEESQEILLKSLESSGVTIPPGVSSVDDLTPATLVSICTQSLRIIDPKTSSFPASLPDSMADRFKICSHLASAVTGLGFIGDVSFHKFLYPSEEDLYKLMRFFVKKLSELPEEVREAAKKRVTTTSSTTKETDLEDTLSNNNWTDEADNHGSDLNVGGVRTRLEDLKLTSEFPESSNSRCQDSINEDMARVQDQGEQMESLGNSRIEKRNAEEALYAVKPEALEKLKKLKEIEQELAAVLSETKKREKELSKLSTDLENQAKLPSRRSYIQRITEITKNSRKQDTDIAHILKETRELQLESNYIQERLNRTYAVVDETVFREAKKDPVGRQAYKLLTSIHESFEEISDKILSTDRIQREVAEYEAKLSALARRSFNIEKLQADLDAIRRENEFLERHTDGSKIL